MKVISTWPYQWDSLCSPIHVGQRPLNWEVRNFLLDDFSNSASSNSFQITAKAGNYTVPRILARSKVRGFIASNYVSEFHSKLKAFMSDSR